MINFIFSSQLDMDRLDYLNRDSFFTGVVEGAIGTDRIIAITFALGSALAAAAGVLIGMQIPKIDPLMGIPYGLKAFVAAVLGGIGSIPGAVLGGLLIGMSEVMVVGYLSASYRDAIAFGILILVLLLRPQGLLGRVHKEKV
jgi:branched-chain amino acid transport system permease protein